MRNLSQLQRNSLNVVFYQKERKYNIYICSFIQGECINLYIFAIGILISCIFVVLYKLFVVLYKLMLLPFIHIYILLL